MVKTMIQRLMRRFWSTEWFVAFGFRLVYPMMRLFYPPQKLIKPYVKRGQTVVDLGCSTGYYTLAIAESVGPGGKVHAVDFNRKSISALDKKLETAGHQNVETHVSSATDLSFIEDNSIDLVFANGLL